MMPASTKGDPVGAMAAAMRSAVGGLTALQSTKTGLLLLAVSVGTNRCASATASPGGRIERMKSLAAISSSEAGVMPAAPARLRVSGLRPVSEVSTLTPLSVSLRPTPAPIMPGAITATTGVMLFSRNCLLLEPKSCGLRPPMARLLPGLDGQCAEWLQLVGNRHGDTTCRGGPAISRLPYLLFENGFAISRAQSRNSRT